LGEEILRTSVTLKEHKIIKVWLTNR